MAFAVDILGLLLALMARFGSCGPAQERAFAEVRCGHLKAVCNVLGRCVSLCALVPLAPGAVDMILPYSPARETQSVWWWVQDHLRLQGLHLTWVEQGMIAQ